MSVTPEEAESLYTSGQYEASLKAYRAIYESTRATKHLYNIAIQLYHLNKFSEASAILEKIRNVESLFPDVEMFLGFCYRSMNKSSRALLHFNDLSKRTSGEHEVRCRMMVGLLHDEQGNVDEAEKIYSDLTNNALLGNVEKSEVQRRLATIKENKKDWLTALSLYKESLLLDPEGEPALAAKFRIAICLMELSAPGEAAEYLQQVEENSPDTFLGQSAKKVRKWVDSSIKNMQRQMKAYE